MKEGLHFRPYAAADDSDLSRLIREILGRDCDGRILEWKYRRNPAGDPLSVVAEKHGKVIGQIGAVPVRFSVRGNEHIGSQEVDGCLDKEQGKFDTLFHMIRLRRKINREKGIAFSYFFSVEISSQWHKNWATSESAQPPSSSSPWMWNRSFKRNSPPFLPG